ncbi:hypothetical protein B0H17DRAFT_1187138 [Mycena rosella]|uniref:Uncharacterized protein n=1 Tax=Mycena rosella TaxID=1033263 RepID=A0AAD7C6W9_MYCRO|nr:hypothetical protein B0H17DRAFT_1187138 [Mycena rosella]
MAYLSQWSTVLEILSTLSFLLLGVSLILLVFARVGAILKRPKERRFDFIPLLDVLRNLYRRPEGANESADQIPLDNMPGVESSSRGRSLPSGELPVVSPSSLEIGVKKAKSVKIHWEAGSKILLGRSAWLDPVTQSKDYPWFRASVYAVLVPGLILLALLRIVIDPIREIGHPVVVETRFPTLSDDFTTDPAPLWNILAMINLDELEASQINTSVALDNFHNAVDVTPLWDDTGSKPNCTHTPGVLMAGDWGSGAAQYDARHACIQISCSDRLGIGSKLAASDAVGLPTSDIWPDLLVTVNFTTLGMESRTLVNNRARTVSIIVALTDQIDDILADSSPIPLSPDLYLLATVTTEFREYYKWTAAATIGVLTFTKVHFTVAIALLVPDPSPLIARINNTATLRVYMGTDFRMDILMLWWGRKPLSVFGWIHRANKVNVGRIMTDRYNDLQKDVPTSTPPEYNEFPPPPRWGAFLRDLLVDVELVSSSNTVSSSTTGLDAPSHSTQSSTVSRA